MRNQTSYHMNVYYIIKYTQMIKEKNSNRERKRITKGSYKSRDF